jgi:hypothetical protein
MRIWNRMLGKQVTLVIHLAEVKAIPTYYTNQLFGS